MTLGWINIRAFIEKTGGHVVGQLQTDAKFRTYEQQYNVTAESKGVVTIQRADGAGDAIRLPAQIPLDSALIGFFGLYSGDGAKGAENPKAIGRVKVSVSFSQVEPNLVRFAVSNFRRFFHLNSSPKYCCIPSKNSSSKFDVLQPRVVQALLQNSL